MQLAVLEILDHCGLWVLAHPGNLVCRAQTSISATVATRQGADNRKQAPILDFQNCTVCIVAVYPCITTAPQTILGRLCPACWSPWKTVPSMLVTCSHGMGSSPPSGSKPPHTPVHVPPSPEHPPITPTQCHTSDRLRTLVDCPQHACDLLLWHGEGLISTLRVCCLVEPHIEHRVLCLHALINVYLTHNDIIRVQVHLQNMTRAGWCGVHMSMT